MVLALPDRDMERILVIIAHPDDAEFWVGGTVAQWTDSGIQVTYCVLTDGSGGGFDPDIPRPEIPHIRRAEQQQAAKLLGVSEVRFFGLGEQSLMDDRHELHEDLVRVIRQVRPQRVVCQSPERNWARLPASHPDHMAAGEATLQAVYPDARNPFAHPVLFEEEGLDAWAVPEVWVMGSPRPDHWVDITDTFSSKIAALRAHVSQTGHQDELERTMRQWGEANARLGGLPEGVLAEGFMVVTVPI